MKFLVETKTISDNYGIWTNSSIMMYADDIYSLVKNYFGDFEIVLLKKTMAVLKAEKDGITTIKMIYLI